MLINRLKNKENLEEFRVKKANQNSDCLEWRFDCQIEAKGIARNDRKI